MRGFLHRLVRNRRVRDAVFYPLSVVAFLWRRLMFRTTFIAITGSVGKSTATACLGAILSEHIETNWMPGGRNSRFALMRAVLRTRFHHRFTVLETGTRARGTLRKIARLTKPDVVLVLRVLRVHSEAFAKVEEVAVEKAQLLSCLGKRGVAVLNADDPLVAAMSGQCQGVVRMFGKGSDCVVRASDVSSTWPARLSFRLHSGDESIHVRMKLVGEHFVNSVLGAAAVALHCGVPLAKVAAALGKVEPVPGRMQPMPLPNGAMVLRDDYHSTLPTLESALAVLREAEAARRVVILGDVLDTGLTSRPRARLAGRLISDAADVAVFIGDLSPLWKKEAVRAGFNAERAFALPTVRDAAEFLTTELRAGDLVLLKDWSGRHTERAILAQIGSFACWRTRCRRMDLCDTCPELKLVPIAPATAAGGVTIL